MTTMVRNEGDDEQLRGWVAGKPVHGVECCPDFSCCHAELLQPLEVRQQYMAATGRAREQLLARFLAALCQKIAPGQVLVVGPDGEPG